MSVGMVAWFVVRSAIVPFLLGMLAARIVCRFSPAITWRAVALSIVLLAIVNIMWIYFTPRPEWP